jgi:hypothetical protein
MDSVVVFTDVWTEFLNITLKSFSFKDILKYERFPYP